MSAHSTFVRLMSSAEGRARFGCTHYSCQLCLRSARRSSADGDEHTTLQVGMIIPKISQGAAINHLRNQKYECRWSDYALSDMTGSWDHSQNAPTISLRPEPGHKMGSLCICTIERNNRECFECYDALECRHYGRLQSSPAVCLCLRHRDCEIQHVLSSPFGRSLRM